MFDKKTKNRQWQSVATLTEANIAKWSSQVEDAIVHKKKRHNFDEVQRIAPLLKRAKDGGLSFRDISKITGISATNLCEWSKRLKETKDAE